MRQISGKKGGAGVVMQLESYSAFGRSYRQTDQSVAESLNFQGVFLHDARLWLPPGIDEQHLRCHSFLQILRKE